MLVSTLQMSGADALQDYFPPVSCNGKLLERVTTATILGFHMDKHLTRVDHVTALLSSWYAALAVLRKWHNLAPYHVYIYAKQFNSGVISDVKTGLRVGHLVSPPSLSNEMAANRVQTTCTGLYLSGRILFLRTSKNWTGYPLLKGETWHCWNPFLKPLLLGLITYALNFILSLPISTKVGYSNWKRHFSGLGSEIVFNSLPDKLRQQTDYRKFVWWAKPCSPKAKVYNRFFWFLTLPLQKILIEKYTSSILRVCGINNYWW